MNSLETTAAIIRKSIPSFPETLCVLGSGWNKFLAGKTVETELSYADMFGRSTSVPGHDGKLVVVRMGKKRIACMVGRFHLYEGYTGEEVTLPIRAFASLGVKSLVLTAACGALNPSYRVGDFVILSDMTTLFLRNNPLVGPQFIDVSRVFDSDMTRQAKQTATEHNIPHHEGIYVYYPGPNYETPADKRALRTLGADVCGMSIVPEVLAGRLLGLRILGLAFVTNLAFVKHDHTEVVAQANAASGRMTTLLSGIVSA